MRKRGRGKANCDKMTDLDLTDDIIDVRNIIARFEEIEESEDANEIEQRDTLASLLSELQGNGGDEQWRGDWYPLTLIRDSYFEDYARELAEDIGAVDKNAGWPNQYIDWEAASEALQMDYTSIDIEGGPYWYR